jgi:hypothetical protein
MHYDIIRIEKLVSELHRNCNMFRRVLHFNYAQVAKCRHAVLHRGKNANLRVMTHQVESIIPMGPTPQFIRCHYTTTPSADENDQIRQDGAPLGTLTAREREARRKLIPSSASYRGKDELSTDTAGAVDPRTASDPMLNWLARGTEGTQVDDSSKVDRFVQPTARDANIGASTTSKAHSLGSADEPQSQPTYSGRVSALSSSSPETAKLGPNLVKYGVDLTKQARDAIAGGLSSNSGSRRELGLGLVVGREEEINRAMQVLSRKTKNNPCFIGSPGVGKTTIVEGLARKIASGQCPQSMKNKSIISLNMASMLAGAKFRGEFEERLKNIIKDIEAGTCACFQLNNSICFHNTCISLLIDNVTPRKLID